MRRAFHWLVLLAAVLWLPACDQPDERRLERWELTVEDGPGPVDVVLPVHLDSLLPAADTTYWLRTELELHELHGPEPSLVVPYLAAITSLRVNDQPAVSTRSETAARYRRTGPHVWRLPAIDGATERVRLELRVEHRWTQSGWLDTVPRLVPADELGGSALAVLLLNELSAIASLSGLLLIGFMSLGVFLADRSRRYYLWFGVQLLAASVYPLYVAGYLQLAFGIYDTVLLAIGLDLALFAALMFSRAELGIGGLRPTSPWTLSMGLAVLLAVVAPGPYSITPLGVRATVIALAAVVVYQLGLGLRFSLRRPRSRGSSTVLVGWLVLGLTSSFDGIAWLGLGEPLGGARVACLGLGAFAVLSSLRLTREHTRSLRTTDRLNHQLEHRIEALETQRSEVERLNEQLRSQMSHRSRQLFSMLSMVGGPPGPATVLVPGDLVGSKYLITHQLGAGGMGVVYAVLRQADEMRLALKIAVHADAWGLARLAREAEIAIRVDHPNVVTVTEVDIDPRGFLYLVMEHVDGPTLSEYQKGFGRDRLWALDVLQQVAAGLAGLHAEGVVHRDLKPANVLLLTERDGRLRVKITDFGIARMLDAEAPVEPPRREGADLHRAVARGEALDAAARRLLDAQVRGEAAERSRAELHAEQLDPLADASAAVPPGIQDEATRPLRGEEVRELEAWAPPSSSLTQADCIVGTPVYMAPELAFDPPLISPAADVFSFGVLAHQLITGTTPFDEPPVLLVVDGRPLPDELELDLLRIPSELRPLLSACLSLVPDDRPTAARLATTLAELRASAPTISLDEPSSRPSSRVHVEGLVEVLSPRREPDAPSPREHGTSPPEPHAA